MISVIESQLHYEDPSIKLFRVEQPPELHSPFDCVTQILLSDGLAFRVYAKDFFGFVGLPSLSLKLRIN